MDDDIAKSQHMANIGGSVYHDVPREGYWVDREDNPSPLMRQSLLYKLHTYKIHKNHNPVIEKCVLSPHYLFGLLLSSFHLFAHLLPHLVIRRDFQRQVLRARAR